MIPRMSRVVEDIHQRHSLHHHHEVHHLSSQCARGHHGFEKEARWRGLKQTRHGDVRRSVLSVECRNQGDASYLRHQSSASQSVPSLSHPPRRQHLCVEGCDMSHHAAISSGAFSISVSAVSPFSTSLFSTRFFAAYTAVSTVFPSADILSFFRILQPPFQPIHPSSQGPRKAIIINVTPMKSTLQLPLLIHPPCAYNLLPTDVPVSCPQNVASIYAVLTRFLALGSMA